MRSSIILWIFTAAAGCHQPDIRVTVVDGRSGHPLKGVNVEYYSYSPSIFARAQTDQHRKEFGSTDGNGRIELSGYDNRGIASFFFIKAGYGPSDLTWTNASDAHIEMEMPATSTRPTKISSVGGIDVTRPLVVEMFESGNTDQALRGARDPSIGARIVLPGKAPNSLPDPQK
jgi:hypothetical protein